MSTTNKEITKKAETPEKVHETVKFNNWVKAFMDKGNPKTYGNATQSALASYDTVNYHAAAVIGHENVKKLKHLASMYAETRGVTLGTMINVAVQNMHRSRSPEWWDRLMKMFGYAEEAQENPSNLKKRIIAEEFFQ